MCSRFPPTSSQTFDASWLKRKRIIIDGVKNINAEMSKNEVREFRRKIKEEYGSFYNQITEIFNRYDPIDLIKIGAPSDEYGYEISRILSKLKNAKSVLEARTIIYEVFDQSFNYGYSASNLSKLVKIGDDFAGTETDYHLIAEEVWAAWETFKRRKAETKD